MSKDSSSKPAKSNTAAPVESAKKSDGAPVSWGPASAIIVSIVSFIVGFVVAGGTAYLVAGLMGSSQQQANDWLNSVYGQFLFVLLAEGLVVGTVVFFLHRRKTSLRAVGFHRSPIASDVGFALIGFVVYFIALIAATAFAQHLFKVNIDQKQELGFDNVATAGQKLVTFISLVVLPPLAEETLFRGFLYTGLRKKLPYIWTALFVSLAFASLHLMEGSQGLLWIAGIDTFILSMVLCYLREKTGNLWAGILVHALKNGLAFTFLYIIGVNV
ncbi:MAG TPA: type II CAAX endopeptidase family protein [Patescibacteria group bacterium]|nr:type II CAAX endopeptidase family protein [Patescibacteria group bacterium]